MNSTIQSRLAFAMFLAVLAPAATAARELSTDRPDLTESPFSVPRGWVQLEMDGLVWARNEVGDIVTRTLALAPVNLKLGFTDHHDLQIVFEPWVRQRVTLPAGTPGPRTFESQGSGELAVRLKWNLRGNDDGGPGLGLLPWVAWDTRVDRARFVSAAGIAMPVALDLTERVGLGAMLEASEADTEWATLGTATLAFDIAGSLGAFGEVAAERIFPDAEEAYWNNTLNAGATLGIGPDLQLDGGVRVGVSEAADDLTLFLGLAARRALR